MRAACPYALDKHPSTSASESKCRSVFAELILDELGQRTRDIYVLFRLESMKQKEIAALFGIARSTVEKEVMKATLHLALRCKGKPR